MLYIEIGSTALIPFIIKMYVLVNFIHLHFYFYSIRIVFNFIHLTFFYSFIYNAKIFSKQYIESISAPVWGRKAFSYPTINHKLHGKKPAQVFPITLYSGWHSCNFLWFSCKKKVLMWTRATIDVIRTLEDRELYLFIYLFLWVFLLVVFKMYNKKRLNVCCGCIALNNLNTFNNLKLRNVVNLIKIIYHIMY